MPSDVDNDISSWDQYGKHVLTELKRLSSSLNDLSNGQSVIREEIARLSTVVIQYECKKCPFDQEEITNIRVEIAAQKVKVGLFAAVLGTISGSVVSLVAFLMKS